MLINVIIIGSDAELLYTTHIIKNHGVMDLFREHCWNPPSRLYRIPRV